MKVHDLLAWSLAGGLLASTIANILLVQHVCEQPAPASPPASAPELTPVLRPEDNAKLVSLGLSKEQCERIQCCSVD